MKKRFAYTVSVLAAVSIATVGCAPRMLDPGAQNTRIETDQNHQLTKNCKYLGQISDANSHGGINFLSEKAMELDDINFLKNEGTKLGANTVVFSQHQVVVSNEKSIVSKGRSGTYRVVKHNVEGKAYFCPTNTMASLKQMRTRVTKSKDPRVMQQYSIDKSGVLLNM